MFILNTGGGQQTTKNVQHKGFSIDIRPVLSSNSGLHYALFDIILQDASHLSGCLSWEAMLTRTLSLSLPLCAPFSFCRGLTAAHRFNLFHGNLLPFRCSCVCVSNSPFTAHTRLARFVHFVCQFYRIMQNVQFKAFSRAEPQQGSQRKP